MVPRFSAALKSTQGGLRHGAIVETELRTWRRYSAAIDGRSWIPEAVCAGGRSTAITEKMSLSGRASSWGDRAQLRLSTLTPKRESRIDVNPFTVRLNLHGDLDFFLRSGARGRSIERSLSEKTSVKDVIESCGVPHPEVDLILANGQPVDFHYAITSDADIELYPVEQESRNLRNNDYKLLPLAVFVADGHLGKLARDLRLLGFDVAYDSTRGRSAVTQSNGTRKPGAPDAGPAVCACTR